MNFRSAISEWDSLLNSVNLGNLATTEEGGNGDDSCAKCNSDPLSEMQSGDSTRGKECFEGVKGSSLGGDI